MASPYLYKPDLPDHISGILTPYPTRHDDFLGAARKIAAASPDGMRVLKAAYVASFTIDQLVPYVTVELARRGVHASGYIAPFRQVEQELMDAGSGLHRYEPDVVFVAVRLEDVVSDLQSRLLENGAAACKALVQQSVDGLVTAIRSATARSRATFFVFNMCEPSAVAAGIASAIEEFSEAEAVHSVNRALADLARQGPSIHVVDYRAAAIRHGLEAWHDRKLWYWTRSPLSFSAMSALSEVMARTAIASVRPSCKCLVLDCDNTLWGGVIGEDSLDGIQLGESYPGNVFRDFHVFLRSLKARGIILAIASKNNAGDVLGVLENHPDSLLKPDDFSVMEVHWNDKASSIQRIAQKLNIGLDAIAFFDDSPVERQWLKEALPMVRVIDAPTDPLQYVSAVRDSELFDQLSISAEDRERHNLYQAEQERSGLQQAAASMEDFLRRLEMQATIGRVGEDTLRRVGQLLLKTNQFNLSLRRHSPADILGMLRAGTIGLWMRLEDKFGDNGLVAVALASPDGEEWEVDTFLMSCRVLGRQAETLLLHVLGEQCRKKGAKRLRGIYVPGPKNQQVSDFYERHKFRPGPDKDSWIWDFSEGPLETAEYIECKMAE